MQPKRSSLIKSSSTRVSSKMEGGLGPDAHRSRVDLEKNIRKAKVQGEKQASITVSYNTKALFPSGE